MKRILSLLLIALAISVLVGMLGFSASAEGEDVKLRISGMKKDGTVTLIENHTSLEDGWNKAMDLASDSSYLKKNAYSDIVVDLLCDWNAKDGEFTGDFFNGPGFNWDAIYVPDDACLVFNLNGHTINRGLTEWEFNGEVMYIDEDASVTINGGNLTDTATEGTIKGGFSSNGAGGIHINDNASVVLNNVNLSENTVEDDDGAAVALYNGASLFMYGGSISNNRTHRSGYAIKPPYGAIYAKDSNVHLSSVDIVGNYSTGSSFSSGVAIFSDDSHFYVEDCTIKNNGAKESASRSIINVEGGEIYLINTVISENGIHTKYTIPTPGEEKLYSTLIYTTDATLFLSGCEISYNESPVTLDLMDTDCNISNCEFKNNSGSVITTQRPGEITGQIKECTFRDNALGELANAAFHFKGNREVQFTDCDFTNSSFRNGHYMNVDGNLTGAIFSTGSLAIIISMLSLILSAVLAVFYVIERKKNKAHASEGASQE